MKCFTRQELTAVPSAPNTGSTWHHPGQGRKNMQAHRTFQGLHVLVISFGFHSKEEVRSQEVSLKIGLFGKTAVAYTHSYSLKSSSGIGMYQKTLSWTLPTR